LRRNGHLVREAASNLIAQERQVRSSRGLYSSSAGEALQRLTDGDTPRTVAALFGVNQAANVPKYN